jgi:8-oxo-dGTP diphosphatase
MADIRFFDIGYVPDAGITYSVIAARFRGKWVFVRHRLRKSFEIPGGHIEEKETPDDAAKREFSEETGALKFSLVCVATYSVEKEGKTGYGRLFFAEVSEFGPITDKSEIDEVVFEDSLPSSLSYPDIQPVLFDRVLRYIQELPS